MKLASSVVVAGICGPQGRQPMPRNLEYDLGRLLASLHRDYSRRASRLRWEVRKRDESGTIAKLIEELADNWTPTPPGSRTVASNAARASE